MGVRLSGITTGLDVSTIFSDTVAGRVPGLFLSGFSVLIILKNTRYSFNWILLKFNDFHFSGRLQSNQRHVITLNHNKSTLEFTSCWNYLAEPVVFQGDEKVMLVSVVPPQ